MTLDERWRLWKGLVAALLVLMAGAMAVTVVKQSAAGVVVVLGLSALLVALLFTANFRDQVVPPYLQGLDNDQRRLVAALARSGGRAPDPVLAGAVVASARRQRTGHALFLASGAIPVGVRLSHLLAGGAGAGGAFDTVVILVWLVLAVFLTRGLVRTTKAISANR